MNTPDITALTTCLRGSSVDTLRQLADRLEADAHGLWRLGVLLDTAEFCIKFRAVYVLAECLRAKIPFPGKIGGDFTKPTLGDWAAVLREGSKALLRCMDTMIAVPDLLMDQSLGESIAVIVDARNSRAHGATLSASQAFAESARIIAAVIAVAGPLHNKKWELLGEALQVDGKDIEAPSGSHWSSPYLRTQATGCIAALFPWLVKEESSEGTLLLIFNRDNQTASEPGTLDYLDYGSGEQRNLATECRGAVQDALKFFKLASYGPNWQSHIIERHRQFYVGRESELEQLRNFVSCGTGEVQIVTGPPGFGKTSLLAKLVAECDTIRQFVTVTDDATTDTKAILKNLRRQLAARLDSPDGRASHDTDEKTVYPREVIVIDGLDEAKDMPGLLRKLQSDDALQKARFIFGGQPHVLGHIKNTFGDDRVNELELAGLSLDQTKDLAELHELRHLSRHDIEALHEGTQGGPLFLRTVFHDLSTGAIPSSDLHSLPRSVEDYWDTLLSRHNPTGVNRDADSIRYLKRISADAFQTVLNVWKIEPPERGELSKEFGQAVERRLRMELTVLLGILAQSHLPLSVLHLSEIVPTTDQQFVPKALKDLGSLVDVDEYAEQVKLCHGSLRSFLLCRHNDAIEEAKGLLREWAWNWVADTSGVRAKVLCSVCDQAELIATLNDWAFFNHFLSAWGFDETTQLYESNVEGVQRSVLTKQRLQDAFLPLPHKLVVDMNANIAGQTLENRGGARVIIEHDTRRLEREEEHEQEASAESYASEGDETDDSADAARIWEWGPQQDDLEAKWKREELPPEWFGDWTSCERALSGLRAGYRQVLDGPPPLEEPSRDACQSLRVTEFLKRCKRQLSASHPDISLVAYNSGVFRDTPLDRELREQITHAHACWIEREHRHSASPFADSEMLHREIGQSFIVAAGSSVVCYVRAASGAQNAPELVCEDWRDLSQPARVLLPSRPNQRIEALCLSFDGKTVLVESYERGEKRGEWPSRLLMIDTTTGTLVREILIESGREFKRLFDATPDLNIILVELDGQVALVNSTTGAITELPLLDKIEYSETGRLSRDGLIVIFRRRYGSYIGFDTVRRKLLDVGSRSDGEKGRHFQIDPTGGLCVERGRLFSISEHLCVRDFDKSRDQDCAAFSLDSRILLIASASVLRAYDVRVGQQIGEYPLREPCSAVVLSADGSLALLRTQSDNLLVIDLLKSAVSLIDPPTLKDQTAIISYPDDPAAFFWNEQDERILKCWEQSSGVSTHEANTTDFELSGWTPGSGEYKSPMPLFKAGDEIWFRCQHDFQFAILQLDQQKVEPGVSLLGDSASPDLLRTIRDNLKAFHQARITSDHGRPFPDPCFDGGIVGSGIRPPRALMYCPKCRDEQVSATKPVVWLRLHQLSAVVVCPKHEVFLEPSSVVRSPPERRNEFVSAHATCAAMNGVAIDRNNRVDDLLLSTARDVEWVLRQVRLHPGREKLRALYVRLLFERNLATPSGRLRLNQLVPAFVDHFSKDVLQVLQSGDPHVWLPRLLRAKRSRAAPVRHLLLINFLGFNAEEFFEEVHSGSYSPKRPLVCRNLICRFFGVTPPQRATIWRSLTVLEHCCQCCGFKYRLEDERDDRHSILDYGHIWREELHKLWLCREISLRAIARRLGVQSLTARRWALKLGLEFPRFAVRTSQAPRKLTLGRETKQDVKESKRTAWELLRLAHPHQTVTELRRLRPSLYAALYRSDKAWLLDSRPSRPRFRTKGQLRADWQGRDAELAARVPSAANEIQIIPGKPIRITVARVARSLASVAYLEKHLRKLPRTRAILDAIIDTHESFALRRLLWAERSFFRESHLPKSWELVRRTGLRPQVFSLGILRDALTEALLRLNNHFRPFDESRPIRPTGKVTLDIDDNEKMNRSIIAA
ncbi:MAG: TnsD family Tn7-like transposition protein [Chthoniobacteraceae bacterium]